MRKSIKTFNFDQHYLIVIYILISNISLTLMVKKQKAKSFSESALFSILNNQRFLCSYGCYLLLRRRRVSSSSNSSVCYGGFITFTNNSLATSCDGNYLLLKLCYSFDAVQSTFPALTANFSTHFHNSSRSFSFFFSLKRQKLYFIKLSQNDALIKATFPCKFINYSTCNHLALVTSANNNT